MKSVISLIMATVAFISSLFSNTVIPQEKADNFKPVLRFLACSDTHINGPEDPKLDRIRTALDFAYGLKDGNYTSLDAALFAGDITDNGTDEQFDAVRKIMKEVIKGDTELLALVAKGHDSVSQGKKSLEFVTSITGKDSDFHVVINGFHFICISTCSLEGVDYTESQRIWLRRELDKASADDPDKPIFLAHHEHVADTVYGSDSVFERWGRFFFKDIISSYPQVIDISGHSHYPLNDPRSIWQGNFTAIGTGAMHYMEFTVGLDRSIHPEGCYDNAQAWIIEVDKDNNVRLRGFDVLHRAWLCDYLLTDITDIKNHAYTQKNQKALSSAPEFAADAKVTVKEKDGKTTVTFPAASSTDGKPVFLYRIKIKDDNGLTVYDGYKINNYWTVDEDKVVEFTVDGTGKTAYVCAENAYEMQSGTITGTR